MESAHSLLFSQQPPPNFLFDSFPFSEIMAKGWCGIGWWPWFRNFRLSQQRRPKRKRKPTPGRLLLKPAATSDGHPIRSMTRTSFSQPSRKPPCAADSAAYRAPSTKDLSRFFPDTASCAASSTRRAGIRIRIMALQVPVMWEWPSAHLYGGAQLTTERLSRRRDGTFCSLTSKSYFRV
jgi:hypothetical protein